MSKVAIVLCAMLFVSAANSFDLSKTLEAIKKNVDQITSAALDDATKKSNASLTEARDLCNQISDEARFIGQKLHNNMNNQLQKAENIDTTSGIPEGLNITECTEFLADLNYTVQAIISNIDACVESKVNTASGYLKSMIKTSNYIIDNLTSIREEIRHCGNNDTDVAAIMCVNIVMSKASWIPINLFPDITVKLTKLKLLLATLRTSMVYCTSTDEMLTFYLKSSTISERTKDCIQQKIEEAHGTNNLDMDHTNEII